MVTDAIQTSANALQSTAARLQDNAHVIAKETANSNPSDTANERPEGETRASPSEEARRSTPDVHTERNSERLVEALTNNVAIEAEANANAKAMKTALEILGQTVAVGDRVNHRA